MATSLSCVIAAYDHTLECGVLYTNDKHFLLNAMLRQMRNDKGHQT